MHTFRKITVFTLACILALQGTVYGNSTLLQSNVSVYAEEIEKNENLYGSESIEETDDNYLYEIDPETGILTGDAVNKKDYVNIKVIDRLTDGTRVKEVDSLYNDYYGGEVFRNSFIGDDNSWINDSLVTNKIQVGTSYCITESKRLASLGIHATKPKISGVAGNKDITIVFTYKVTPEQFSAYYRGSGGYSGGFGLYCAGYDLTVTDLCGTPLSNVVIQGGNINGYAYIEYGKKYASSSIMTDLNGKAKWSHTGDGSLFGLSAGIKCPQKNSQSIIVVYSNTGKYQDGYGNKYRFLLNSVSKVDHPPVSIKDPSGSLCGTISVNSSFSPFYVDDYGSTYDFALDSNMKFTEIQSNFVTIQPNTSRCNIVMEEGTIDPDGEGYYLIPFHITITTDTQAFVSRLYEKCLGRTPDTNGLKHWDSILTNKERSGAQVAYGFVFSKEYLNKNTSDEVFVEMLYNVFLNRQSDPAGKQHWLDLLNEGVSREYIFRGFAQSVEFTKICESYGIERGTFTLTQPRDQNINITRYVTRMYSKALGRKGDIDGINHWCREILTKSRTPEQVAESFINSQEFRNKNLSNEEYIKILYRTFLGREYDQAGLEHWIGELNRGCTRDEILHRFATSAEFKNIQAQFGL